MEDIISQAEEIIASHKERGVRTESYIRLNDIFTKSFKSLFKTRRSLPHLSFSLFKKLNSFFSLSRAVLVVYSPRDDNLKVIALKTNRYSREGLAISLPRENSLLYEIFHNNEIYIKDYSGNFEGNFIEQKLLKSEDSSSIAICPVNHNGSVKGLLCLTSPILYAFSMFRQGFLDKTITLLGRSISVGLNRLNI